MDYYRKKFKPSRSASENSTDVLDELESKWADMQPRIHECAGDKSKVQKQLLEIRSYIEHCQRVEEKVSEEQQERIRGIIRKCKEILTKYGEINTSGVKSPRLFRKAIPVETSDQAAPQNKVALVEVEEKLKSMRQRRLDRLSVFVAEQSKLSEERSTKSNGSNEIENAIKSIQQIGVEKKSSFKSIIEENITENERAEGINIRRHSSESDKSKSFSTKKFINKFNCGATQTIGSSNEDLAIEHDDKKPHSIHSASAETAAQVLDDRNRSSLQKDKEAQESKNNTSRKEAPLNRNSTQTDREELKGNHLQRVTETDDYNPLLSPVGKQRRAIYLYDNECKFLENEKQVSELGSTAFEKNYKQEHPLVNFDANRKGKIGHFYENRDVIAKNDNEKAPMVLTTFGKFNQDNLGKKPDVEPKIKAGHVYENRAIIDKHKSEKTILTTFGRNSKDYELDKKTDIEAKEKMGYAQEYRGLDIKNDNDKSQSGLTTLDGGNTQKNVVPIKTSEGHVSENKQVIANNDTDKLPSFNTSDKQSPPSYENNIISSAYENIKLKPKKSNSLSKLLIKAETTAHRKSNDNVYNPRSPVPLPRRSNGGERVLKKLQRNWDSLNQIIENDSDVDGDEFEDLKKTWEEANTLLRQYKAKIEKLERKPHDAESDEKLTEIKTQLKDVGEALRTFKGLKRDSSYKQLSSRLSNYFLAVNKINCSKSEVLHQKRTLLSEIEVYIKTLENKANKNEAMLLEILEAQVKTIGTKHLNITQV